MPKFTYSSSGRIASKTPNFIMEEKSAILKDRLFSGKYPEGIVYADRSIEDGGDYKRLAFLPYKSLELEFFCQTELKSLILEDAQLIINQKGQRYQISTSGQFVTLGE